jgi:blue copper oxidase
MDPMLDMMGMQALMEKYGNQAMGDAARADDGPHEYGSRENGRHGEHEPRRMASISTTPT